MRIIPVINSTDFETVKKRVLIADSFLENEDRHLHLDISDGKFTPVYSLIDPWALKSFLTRLNIDLKFTVHLMVKNPESHFDQWFAFGAKRIVMPLESLFDPFRAATICKSRGLIPVLSVSPETSIDELVRNSRGFNNFQILAVNAGYSGQELKESTISRIEALQKAIPQGIIEVDGGINDKTILKIKETGAEIVDVGHYIFSDENPADRFSYLKNIIHNS